MNICLIIFVLVWLDYLGSVAEPKLAPLRVRAMPEESEAAPAKW
jgi:hypothetical protein